MTDLLGGGRCEVRYVRPIESWTATAKYLALVTYRRDGTAVSTPVWFVTDGDRLLVWTDASSGKVRRICSDPRVSVAACDVRGRLRSTAATGRACVLDDSVGPRVHGLLRCKHPIMKPIIDAWNRVGSALRRRSASQPAYIEILLGST